MVAQIDSTYKHYGYGKVLRRLSSYALFEGRPHTTKGQWFNPVVFAILRGLNALPGTPVVDKPIFITGLGRSGTTILGILLSLHKDVGFLNEPKAIWRLIDSRHDINGDYVSEGGIFHLDKQDITHQASNTAHRIFGRYLSSVRASRLVDKYPELIFRVDYLLGLFPDARIVFITRNGVDAINSIELWSKRLGVTVGDRVDDWWGRGDIKWKYMLKQIINRDPAYKNISEIADKNLDHINRAALEWIITMREGLSQMETHPDAVIHIKYESLVDNPDLELRHLFSSCHLQHDQNVIDYAEKKLYKTPEKPMPSLLEPIEKSFTQTMNKLGYNTHDN